MNKVIYTAVILLATSSLSYGKCRQEIKTLPEIPSAASATTADFNLAKAEIIQYSNSAKSFARCSQTENNKRSHKRGDRALWKLDKVSKQYNEAYKQFAQRLQSQPNLASL